MRSVGVKDLAYGYLVDDDWEGHDPDAFWTNTGSEVPFLETATHYFVCASLSREPDAPVGRLLGDLLVLRPSAWSHGGRGERLRFPVDQYAHVGGATPLRPAQPPGGLRADPSLAVGRHAAAAGSGLTAARPQRP